MNYSMLPKFFQTATPWGLPSSPTDWLSANCIMRHSMPTFWEFAPT